MYSRIRLSATSMLHRLHRDLAGNKDRVIAWENVGERWIFISMKVVVSSISFFLGIFQRTFYVSKEFGLGKPRNRDREEIEKNR